MTIETVTAIVTSIIAVSSGFLSVLFWYANNEKRNYGLERDIAHVKRNQEQMQQALNVLLVELDKLIERDTK